MCDNYHSECVETEIPGVYEKTCSFFYESEKLTLIFDVDTKRNLINCSLKLENKNKVVFESKKILLTKDNTILDISSDTLKLPFAMIGYSLGELGTEKNDNLHVSIYEDFKLKHELLFYRCRKFFEFYRYFFERYMWPVINGEAVKNNNIAIVDRSGSLYDRKDHIPDGEFDKFVNKIRKIKHVESEKHMNDLINYVTNLKFQLRAGIL